MKANVFKKASNAVKNLLGEVFFSVKFDALFIRTRFFIFFFNMIPNLYSLRPVKRLLLLLSGIRAGHCYVKAPLYAELGKNLSIGKGVFINLGCHFEANAPTLIGDGCHIGPFCRFETTNHHEGRDHYLPIKVGKNVWIGAGCIVLPGAEISDNISIAAGAVVRGKVSGGSLWGGVPARRIK